MTGNGMLSGEEGGLRMENGSELHASASSALPAVEKNETAQENDPALSVKFPGRRSVMRAAIPDVNEQHADDVLRRELVADDLHVSKTDDVIQGVVALALCLVPNGHRDGHIFQVIQRVAHAFAVGDPGFALYPTAHLHLIIAGVEGIHVGRTVPGRREAANECRGTGIACPGQPAEIAGLRAVENIGDDHAGLDTVQALHRQGDGIEVALGPCDTGQRQKTE